MTTSATRLSSAPRPLGGPQAPASSEGTKVSCPAGTVGMVQDGYLRCVPAPAPKPLPAKAESAPALSDGLRFCLSASAALTVGIVAGLNLPAMLLLGACSYAVLSSFKRATP